MIQSLDRFWHRTLGRPYQLARPIDQGSGVPVVLLHGLGRTGRTWEVVQQGLRSQPCRVVAFDLLGFGDSPKPSWLDYTAEDHARAVIAALEALQPRQPAILVGHSMGCLVAVTVARLRPDLVRHLVLYEMPIYKGFPEKMHYRFRLNLYQRLYDQIMNLNPTFDKSTARLNERIAGRIAGFEITPETWQPLTRSLQHTILEQDTAAEIKQLTLPMDVIYGRLDMFVIRGKTKHIFGSEAANIKAHTIRERHVITERAAKFLVSRISQALKDDVVG